MEREEFMEVLEDKGYWYSESPQGKIIIESYSVDILMQDLKSIPPNITFNNKGHIYLESLEVLPEGIVFNNQEGVYLDSVKSISPDVEFYNGGSVYLRALKDIPKGFTFSNETAVDLNSLESLPEGVIFDNGRGVYLKSIRGIKGFSKGVRFNSPKSFVFIGNSVNHYPGVRGISGSRCLNSLIEDFYG
jgi:hypothetical protein